MRDVPSALEAVGAGGCERRDAEVGLIISAYSESVFRAAETGVVDLWQAGLHVVSIPARGVEHADIVYERPLAAGTA